MKKNILVYIVIVILIVSVGTLYYLPPPLKPEYSNKYFCKVDSDCEIKEIECKQCNPMLGCVNKNWESDCDIQENESSPCPPAPPWVTNCKCIDFKCVDCRGNECKA